MTRRETSAEIDADAALWVARVEAGTLDADQERALADWLEGDVRRQGAFAKARAVALHADRARALGADYDAKNFETKERRAVTRRRALVLGGASALAASVALGVGFVWQREAHRYRTRLGQVRVVSLEDGSVLTLNTASEVAVHFTEALRSVELVAGEALFDVAHDPRRPFVVDAGEALVRAIGTSFTVRRLAADPVQVLVREGVVEVTRRDAPQAPPARVIANERAVASIAHPIVATAVPEPQVGREIAWRDGRIAFEGETLRQAAAEFARYSDTRIVFEDPSIADEEITGLFVSTDPVGFSRAVGTAFNLRVDVREGEVRLRR